MDPQSFNALVKEFLGQPLPDALVHQIRWPGTCPATGNFILRMLKLMQRAGYPVFEFTPFLMRGISVTVQSMLPKSGSGYIPPITLQDRHRRFDTYVGKIPWPEGTPPPVFIDLGCGFPPHTTLDTARKLADWSVIGLDHAFAPYVLYDSDGHYACFSASGELKYFQTQMSASGRALNDDPRLAREYFIGLFQALRKIMPPSGSDLSLSAEKDGNRLIHHHIRDFARDNLHFFEGDIQDFECPPARIIRCMNVLPYYRHSGQKQILSAAVKLLHGAGRIIVGFNHYLGRGARYTIYRKRGGHAWPSAFAFSLDNLRPLDLSPWYTLHDEDRDTAFLADIIRSIRSDTTVWPVFNQRVDDLMAHLDISRRGRDGFLHFPHNPGPINELIERVKTLWKRLENEQWADDIVAVLNNCGYRSWVNRVGDVAVQPPADWLSTM